MKKAILIGLVLLTTALAWAGYVGGYYKGDGTYVQSYYRTTARDNYSYYQNHNSYTRKYRTDYYRNNPTNRQYNVHGGY
ncbi:hypothetical protein ACFL57_00395 [Candidatus Margulisiibacteriota bacterium]